MKGNAQAMSLPDATQSAPAAPLPADNRWQVPAEDFQRLRAGPVLCRLADLGVLEVDGPDAVAFLQSQTTADIGALPMHGWHLGGYCTPKGRLLAIFLVWRYEDGLRLLLPQALAPAILQRLSRYVLRAKLRLRDASREWLTFALCGAGGAQVLQQAGVDPPQAAWQSRAWDSGGVGVRVAALPGGAACAQRWLCLAPAAQAAQWERQLAALPRLGPALWWWTQIDAALPAVFSSTSELFVPQTLNLEVLGGVSFRKGCYPGQEIVARSQYLGRLRRRLALAHAPELGPGPDVFASGKADPVGRIVMAATAPGGGWDLLFESAIDEQSGSLHAGALDAPALQHRPLPYVLFDPTASEASKPGSGFDKASALD
jgi:hypothetical protein